MRHDKKTTLFVSIMLALSLTLAGCATDDDDNGDTDNGVTTTTIADITTTTVAG